MDLRVPAAATKTAFTAGLTPQISDMAARLTKPLQTEEARGHGFITELENALRSVSATQNHSAHLQQEVQLENPRVSLEETMIAMQKAQIGFQATLHVRNRLVQAYTDVMNMQV